MVWNNSKIEDSFMQSPSVIYEMGSEYQVIDILDRSPGIGGKRHPHIVPSQKLTNLFLLHLVDIPDIFTDCPPRGRIKLWGCICYLVAQFVCVLG